MVRKNVEANERIELVGANFILTKVENKGAMLGFGADLPTVIKIILLQVLPIVVLLVLFFRVLRKSNMNNWLVFAFACVIGGGIGNLIDRIVYGQVTDFFHIKFNSTLQTGIFNMADVSVSMGVLLILFLSIRYRKLEI